MARLSHKQQIRKWIFLLGLVLLAAGLGAAAYHYTQRIAPALQQRAVADYNADNISLTAVTEPLTAQFAGTQEQQAIRFNFDLQNRSTQQYELDFSGAVLAGEEEIAILPEQQATTIPAQSAAQVSLSLPLRYQDAPLLLRLNLTANIQATFANQPESKTLQLEFPIIPSLLPESNLVKLGILAENEAELNYEADQTPPVLLKYKVAINNLTELDVSNGYWEVYLTDMAGNNIQPLQIQPQTLSALGSSEASGSFELALPPANQLQPGTNEYRYRLLYKGVLAGRVFQADTLSENSFKINVKSI